MLQQYADVGVYPQEQNQEDFIYLLKAGLRPSYTPQMATINAAALQGHQDELGTVNSGKYAGLAAVPANPLHDISLMSRVNFVMKAGVIPPSRPGFVVSIQLTGGFGKPMMREQPPTKEEAPRGDPHGNSGCSGNRGFVVAVSVDGHLRAAPSGARGDEAQRR